MQEQGSKILQAKGWGDEAEWTDFALAADQADAEARKADAEAHYPAATFRIIDAEAAR